MLRGILEKNLAYLTDSQACRKQQKSEGIFRKNSEQLLNQLA